ncbi:unnamed protein product [Fusarium venenatum]|uniref:Uncharacterized protein n=1 Tax=Fusarium venenatum TaxID=56646 RepID=A0A2L2U0C7_9HYPO|nr:uncharacterized protein FVRRES_08417 [Fusarium venenatum]CEI68340.1 unnamed protein product [Fusarium venenatum]
MFEETSSEGRCNMLARTDITPSNEKIMECRLFFGGEVLVVADSGIWTSSLRAVDVAAHFSKSEDVIGTDREGPGT